MVKEIHAVGTLIEFDEKILILHRREDIPQGKTWGLVAGKLEPGESEKEGAVREIFEETGLRVNVSNIKHVRNFKWYFPEITVIFTTFRLKLDKQFDVKINQDEHSEYKWVTPKECYNMKNLIHGFHDLLEKIYSAHK